MFVYTLRRVAWRETRRMEVSGEKCINEIDGLRRMNILDWNRILGRKKKKKDIRCCHAGVLPQNFDQYSDDKVPDKQFLSLQYYKRKINKERY